jgi:hypothetical protein
MLIEAFLDGALIGSIMIGCIGYQFFMKPLREIKKMLEDKDKCVQ